VGLVLIVYPLQGPDQILGASLPLGGHGGNFVWMGTRNSIPIEEKNILASNSLKIKYKTKRRT